MPGLIPFHTRMARAVLLGNEQLFVWMTLDSNVSGRQRKHGRAFKCVTPCLSSAVQGNSARLFSQSQGGDFPQGGLIPRVACPGALPRVSPSAGLISARPHNCRLAFDPEPVCWAPGARGTLSWKMSWLERAGSLEMSPGRRTHP